MIYRINSYASNLSIVVNRVAMIIQANKYPINPK